MTEPDFNIKRMVDGDVLSADVDVLEHVIRIYLFDLSTDLPFYEDKHIYWTNNVLGEYLHEIVMKLVECKILTQMSTDVFAANQPECREKLIETLDDIKKSQEFADLKNNIIIEDIIE